MKALAIDFAPRRHRALAPGLALALAGIGICAAAAWECRAALCEAEALARQVGEARQARQRAASQPPPSPKLSPPAVAAINEAIAALNLPWGELFAVFEADLPGNVALLALEPDARKQVFSVQAEAKSADDMLDFFAGLGAGRNFVEVSLIRHEVDELDPNRPVRFVLQARWGEGG